MTLHDDIFNGRFVIFVGYEEVEALRGKNQMLVAVGRKINEYVNEKTAKEWRTIFQGTKE